jgi:uncharacterized protein (TIGR03000 family)
MKTLARIGFCIALFLTLALVAGTQEKATSIITILVPERGEEETILKIDGKVIGGEGITRTYKTSVEKGKPYTLKLEILVEPNNYTKITRKKEITFKGAPMFAWT